MNSMKPEDIKLGKYYRGNSKLWRYTLSNKDGVVTYLKALPKGMKLSFLGSRSCSLRHFAHWAKEETL